MCTKRKPTSINKQSREKIYNKNELQYNVSFLVELTNTRMVIATLKDARDWNYNKVNWTTAEPRFLLTGFLYLKPFYIHLVYDLKATFHFTIRVGFLEGMYNLLTFFEVSTFFILF